MKRTIFYCYDAYCGWCYAFSPVMKQIQERYKDVFDFEVLSGGMFTEERVQPIGKIAHHIASDYKRVEEMTGITFGADYLWHIKNPEESDWVMNSEKPAIALSIFKEYYPKRQIELASELQYALHAEGRDLDDDEAYRHLLEKYSIQPEVFYEKLKDRESLDAAHYEFALCKQLKVTGFPSVLLQLNESKFYLLAVGYTSFETLDQRIRNLQNEIKEEEFL